MTTNISGCYQNKENKNETIKIDVDGDSPLHVVSGTVTHRLFDNTHWLANLDKVDDRIYEGDIYYTSGYLDNFQYRRVLLSMTEANEVVVKFYIYEKPYIKNFKKTTEYFRSVSLSINHQAGIEPVHSIRPQQHADVSHELTDEDITYQQVFDKAGLKISFNDSSSLDIRESAGYSWSDRELHGAMKSYWSNYSENPQWAMWVFIATTHESGDHIQGKMFDNIGDQHRQGVAVFYQAIENNVPGSQKHNGQKESWIRRQKFWATCHEIGHGFNLYHSWQREDTMSWMPLQNESNIASFMNYPSKYPGKSRQYFKDFLYEFSKSEILFLRHSPDYYMRMGDAKWYDVEGFNHSTPFQDLQLKAYISKPMYDFMETIFISLSLTNTGTKAISLPENILTDDAYLTVIIRKKGGNSFLYEHLTHECGYYNDITLKAGGSAESTLLQSMQVSVGKGGWYISEPGEYTIHAAVYYKEQVSIAAPVRLSVKLPSGEFAEQLAQDHFTVDTANTLYFNGTKTDHKTNDHLIQLIEKIPDQNAAIHARLALAIPDLGPYRILNHKNHKIDVLKPSPEKAYSNLKEVLNHQGAKNSLGDMIYHNYAKVVTDIEDRMNW
ncbi:MAG: hypothetical protein WBA74_13160 [Cyclobacteriaceae bacterium]